MSRARHAAGLLLPWAALFGAAAGWFLAHQVAASAVFDRCTPHTLLIVLVIGLVGLLFTVGGAILSLRVHRGAGDSEARRFIATVGLLLAPLLGLAIILQTASSLIIGSCFG